MTNLIADIAAFLQAQSGLGLIALFWFVIVFELPRYGFLFLVAGLLPRPSERPGRYPGRISVIIAGHSEAAAIKACVGAFREQSRPPDEIIVVSDGSTDGMRAVLADMQRRGIIDQAHCPDLRGGKAAAENLALRCATGDIIVNADCDCSFDRHALRNVAAAFTAPEVGAVGGNVVPRNSGASLVSSFQSIEYLVSLSLGRQAADMLGQISCVSGAFGAFRRNALESVGGLDAGSGEDLDLTLRLRRAGWEIRFAPGALCYTDVPDTLPRLVRQRFRWERDAIHLRYRKHGDVMNPFSNGFQPRELLHELEFLIFSVIACAALPLYLLWIIGTFHWLGFLIALSAQVALILLDLVLFLLAARATPVVPTWRLLPYVPGHSFFYNLVVRNVRLLAYVQEWIFAASHRDTFVPRKVQNERSHAW